MVDRRPLPGPQPIPDLPRAVDRSVKAGTLLGSPWDEVRPKATEPEPDMYAIVEDSGTQIKLSPGDVIDIDLREAAEGETLTFDRVLAVGGEGDARLGRPYVDGATVSATVLGEQKARKIDVIKYKRRKGYKVKKGHRQRYLRVEVTAING